MSLMLTLAVGAGLGAAVGYFSKCSSGTCPLTANWWRGAIYGAVLSSVFYFVSANSGAGSAAESSRNVKLVNEQQFAAEIQNASKPVVVDFFATWCGPCKMLSPMLDELAGSRTNQIVFLKVDIDQSKGLADRFEIEGVPTLIAFRNGKPVDRVVGLPQKQALGRFLDSLAATTGAGEKQPSRP